MAFILSFEDKSSKYNYKQYYLPTVKMKDYNVIFDERNFFDQTVKNNLRTNDNIQKIATGQGDN